MVLYSHKSTVRLDGKTAIVTGSNTGIGKETAKELYRKGAHVILACRDSKKADAAYQDIINSCKNLNNVGRLSKVKLDLSSLNSVRNCSNKLLQDYAKLDLLINNAGVMMCPYGKTEDGFEIQFGTNHLGHFLLTMLLLPKIISSAPSRIINVSSRAHRRGKLNFNDLHWDNRSYSPMGAYGQSKLANILFSKELDRRLKGANIKDVNVYALHPGVIATDLWRHMDRTCFKGMSCMIYTFIRCFMKTPLQGAQTTIYCAIDENAGKASGLYYSGYKTHKPSKRAENCEDAQKLWDISWNLVKLSNYEPFKY